ncbi:gliding motility lipoprotein GldB [Puteibacter caeruleilacunae]|nr:gliding motility lipoprotein GldB [Puteibacter caeruleilacunae]
MKNQISSDILEFNMMGKVVLILGMIIGVATMSCNRNPLSVNVSNIDVDMKLNRLDQALFNHTSLDSIKVGKLERQFSGFFNYYGEEVLRIGSSKDSMFVEEVNRFIQDSIGRNIYKDVQALYDDLSWLKSDLEKAFKHYKYYFPNAEVPDIYTFMSGFNQSILVAPKVIGIGLDKYLGTDSRYYAMLQIPQYKRYIMSKDKIVPDCMLAWGLTEFPFNNAVENLLSYMIYHGKIMYFVDAMLPEVQDSIKIGYTSKQIEFCEAGEPGFWTFLVEKKLIFSSDRMVKRRFINNAPYTSDFTPESPGRTGIWMGWQIVRSYMKNNPECTLEQLMNNHDYQKILNQSGYAPGY